MTDNDAVAAPVSGWVVFSVVVIFVAALANLVYGLTMVFKNDWIVITPEAIVRFDATTAGIIALVFAALGVFAGLGVLGGFLWARLLGILGAAINLVTHMVFLSLYPAWAWLIIIVDGLVIYGLAVHGDDIAEL